MPLHSAPALLHLVQITEGMCSLQQGIPQWWCLPVRMTTFENIELILLNDITCMCDVGLGNSFASLSVYLSCANFEICIFLLTLFQIQNICILR